MQAPPGVPSSVLRADDQLVEFEIPPNENAVIISNVPNVVPLEQLEGIVGRCGGFHRRRFQARPDGNPGTCFVVVHYFLRSAADLAKRGLDGLDVEGRRIVVRSLPSDSGAGRKLSGLECVEIANSLFGFNGHSSSIPEVVATVLRDGSVRAVATVSVTVPSLSVCATGTGFATAGDDDYDEGSQGAGAVGNAKKKAIVDARRAAFAQLVVVVIGGRVRSCVVVPRRGERGATEGGGGGRGPNRHSGAVDHRGAKRSPHGAESPAGVEIV